MHTHSTMEVAQPLRIWEREIVAHLAEGCSQRKTARRLGMTQALLRTHLHAAMERLECGSPDTLVNLAVDRGWVPYLSEHG